MNRVHVRGWVKRAPTIRTFENGDRVAQTTIAVENYQSEPGANGGEGKPRGKTYEYFRVRFHGPATGGLVDRVEKYVKENTNILVSGKLTNQRVMIATNNPVDLTYIDVRFGGDLEILFDRNDSTSNKNDELLADAVIADGPGPVPQPPNRPTQPATPPSAARTGFGVNLPAQATTHTDDPFSVEDHELPM